MFASCFAKKEGAEGEENEEGIIVPNDTNQDREEGDDDQIKENLGDQLGEDASPTAEDGAEGQDDRFRSESEVHEQWRQDFKGNFSDAQLNRRSTIQLATNVQTIYLTLVGLSALAQKNQEAFEDDKRDYYANLSISSVEEDSDEDDSADEEVQMKLDKALESEAKIKINASKFLAQNEEYAIPTIPCSPDDEVTISEFAP